MRFNGMKRKDSIPLHVRSDLAVKRFYLKFS
jgi:hypothetical protein